MSWLVIKNETDDDYIYPGIIAIQLTTLLRNEMRGYADNIKFWEKRVMYIGVNIEEFAPILLGMQDDTFDDITLDEFLFGDIVENWRVIDDLPSGLYTMKDAYTYAMRVTKDGGVWFKSYVGEYNSTELYTLKIQIADILNKSVESLNWDEYLKGDKDE